MIFINQVLMKTKFLEAIQKFVFALLDDDII